MKASRGPLAGPMLPGIAPPAPTPPSERLPSGDPTPDDRPLTVSQLASVIERALRTGVPAPIRVIGEVSGFRDRTHWWFDLKDEGAVISCAMFQSAARKAGFTPTNGQEVVATGRVAFYDKQGKTQIYVDSLKPVGVGELEMRYRALCEELRALGWFDHERKRELPWFPRRIAVITSRTGAALQDVLNTMNRRCPAVGATIIDVRVQGDAAAGEVAAAIDWVSREHESMGVDAIIVTRGGGSMEDLWAFNERVVAQAIVRCAIPVVAAIGHETDTTIAELVADERCATPTQAAMRLTPDRASLGEQLDQYERRLGSGLRASVLHQVQRVRAALRSPLFADPMFLVRRPKERLEADDRRMRDALRRKAQTSRVRVERLASRLAVGRPEAVYAVRSAKIVQLEQRLRASLRHDFERRSSTLTAMARTLDAIGPMNVLRRGFSVTLDDRGNAVRDPSQVRAGDRLATRVEGGTVRSIVEGTRSVPAATPSQARDAAQAAARRQGRPARPDAPRDQMDLF
ncbi:MAG: exodeoxyribonuclease VII large subunit [Phycisphaeraceae bacterium]|nr:exodeoxyribonuclease VII large subunit [Phycisphaeraceae bacterium]